MHTQEAMPTSRRYSWHEVQRSGSWWRQDRQEEGFGRKSPGRTRRDQEKACTLNPGQFHSPDRRLWRASTLVPDSCLHSMHQEQGSSRVVDIDPNHPALLLLCTQYPSNK